MAQLKFTPVDYSTKKFNTDQIAGAITSELRNKIHGYKGCKVTLTKTSRGPKIDIEIAISGNSKDAHITTLTKLGFKSEEKFTLSDNLKDALKDFVNLKQEIPTATLELKTGRLNTIKLNPSMCINAILEKAPDGYEYVIEDVIVPAKSKVGYIIFNQIRSDLLKEMRNRNRRNSNNNRNNSRR